MNELTKRTCDFCNFSVKRGNMRLFSCVAALFFAPIFAGAPVSVAQDTDKQKAEDGRLVAKVREAVEKGIAIERVEEFVKAKATINSSRKEDVGTWYLVKIDLDPKESQIKNFQGVTSGVYWMRPVRTTEWRIVGIAWTEKKEMKLFFGVVLDP